MKILHITNELSKKNISISSFVFYLSKNISSYFSDKYEIIVSSSDYNLKHSKEVYLFKKANFIFFFKLFLSIKRKEIKLIHIHGFWSLLTMYSLFLSILSKKKTIIHPHGMFHPKAISQSNFFKRNLKKIIIYLTRLVISNNNNIFFICITKEELKHTNILFSGTKKFKINNPYPFKLCKKKRNINLKKQFIFLGRMNPHKNIDMIIKAFIKANLPKQWLLKIYAIDDNINYKLKVKNLTKNYNNIKLYNPIFDTKKNRVLQSSWANIVFSNSEVLSFSIMDSVFSSLPVIVSKNINFEINKKLVFQCKHDICSLIKKIKQLSQWSNKKRYKEGIKLRHNINLEKYNKNINKKYINALSTILKS